MRKAYWRDYKFSIIILSASILSSLLLVEYEESISGIFANIVGLTALIIAIISLESSTLKLRDIQTDYWNVRGLDLGKKREYYDAVQAYDKASRLDPQSIKCLINKANDLCEKAKLLCDKDDEGPFIEALEAISHAIVLGPKYPAKLKTGTEDESKAIQEYANALKTECDILLALADHREEYAKPRIDELRNCALKSVNKAISEYERHSKKNPQLLGAYASKANALSKLGNHKEAAEACEEAIGRDHHEAIAWAIRGNALAAKGDYEAAIKNFDEAIRLKPDYTGFWCSKGDSIRKQGNLLKKDQVYSRAIEFLYIAIHAYEKAIEFDPLNKIAWNQMGRTLEDLYQCNLNKDLMSLNSYVMPSDIYSNERMSRPTAINDISDYFLTKALNSYNMAIDIDPNDATFWFNKGHTLRRLGRYSEAIKVYDEVIRLDPMNIEARNEKAICLIYLENHKAALQVLDEVIELDGNNTQACYNRGVVLGALGRAPEAESFRQKPVN